MQFFDDMPDSEGITISRPEANDDPFKFSQPVKRRRNAECGSKMGRGHDLAGMASPRRYRVCGMLAANHALCLAKYLGQNANFRRRLLKIESSVRVHVLEL